ncbi:MAG: hypothetical protein NTW01_09390 [Gammaproteobacteria bacterium]|uniref:hypothetical protein n=1 Tax=Nevskia sp. TaxID=1929292 RepID=UPI003F6FB960|nr:hypothetical protein [Gammaproteobacteria bacterium]
MRLTCRSCGATGSAETVFGDADAGAALLLAGELQPAVARQVWAYLALFRPRERALTWSRTHKLLAELVELIRPGTIRRKHADYVVTQAMWLQALEHMTTVRDSLTLPLKSHGYLLDVLAGYADKSAALAERDQEQKIRDKPGAPPSASAITARQLVHFENEARKRLKMAPLTADEEVAFIAKSRDLSL